MKILMIMYGKGIGGAELQFMELAKELANRHQIRLLTLSGDGAVKSTHLPESIEVRAYPYTGKVATLLGLARAWRENRAFKPQAIVSTAVSSNALAYALNLLRSAKLVSLQTVSKAMRYPVVDRFVLRRFDTLIAGSSDIREYLIGHGQRPGRIDVVNNWVDFSSRKVTTNAHATRQKYGIGDGEIMLGCIGRLHHQKGQEFLIRAFRQLLSRRPGLRLVLVGDGPNADMLRGEAQNLGNAVIFTGAVVGDEYNNLLNAFDLYIQPSRFEGLPRTLLDAMYLGKPIVATAVNGNLDALRDGENGLLVPAEDPEAIVVAVESLLADPDRASALARQAQQDVRVSFDMVRQLRRIELALG
jgi:glycosyltransferase involved in cell wall biosynthesis